MYGDRDPGHPKRPGEKGHGPGAGDFAELDKSLTG